MLSTDHLLYVLAAVCFLLAAIPLATTRINILALGLLFWVLTYLV